MSVQPSPTHGGGERATKNGVHLMDPARREVLLLGQVPVEVVEQLWGDLANLVADAPLRAALIGCI